MSELEKSQPEKKIIIDEDWKSQVQSEKEQQAATAAPHDQERPPPTLPPANISFLFSTIATQALLALGLMPHPASGKTQSKLDEAKHFIDMLAVLQEKTKGNLTPDEHRQLDALLFELRMHFVDATSQKK